MGSRATDKLKEIEEVRASLGRRLHEIENRVPLAGYGKKAAAALAGSSVAASALGYVVKRRFGNKKKKRQKMSAKDVPVMQPVTVNVLPKGAAWIAAVGFAAWAGVKVLETMQRNRSGDAKQQRPAVVTQMPQSGAGS
ncbi:MAG: hypothetical protein WD826_07430 [Actinomycetota bacterium]